MDTAAPPAQHGRVWSTVAWLVVGAFALLQAGALWWAWRDYRRRVAHARDPHPPGCLCERCHPTAPLFG